MRRCKLLWTGWRRRTSYWCRACRRMRIIGSSTRSFRTRPMRTCSRPGVRSCTAGSPRRCAKGPPPALELSPNCWPITLRRPASPRMRLNGGVKGGQRSLERSALLEAGAKFTRGLDQIATLPGTPILRRQQIKLQVGLANALYHTKGFSAVETKAAFDQARAMIERAEALGEHVEDPLVLYSILYGFFIAKFINF